jgi:uncharacterized protein (DUF1330 family)
MIIEIAVQDAAVYARYVEGVRRIVEGHGGRYLARGGKVVPLSGDWHPERVVVIEFPGLERMQECFRSPEYLDLAPLREQSVVSRAIVVEGSEPSG